MTRLERRDYTNGQLGIKQSGGVLDAFDNMVKAICRMTDAEYDYYCDIATDEELDLLVHEDLTYAQKRQLLVLLTTKIYNKA